MVGLHSAHNNLHYMGKEGSWLVIQTEEGYQRPALEEGKCRPGLSAMEEYEWAAGRNTYAAEVAYGSYYTLGPVQRENNQISFSIL